MLKSLSYSSRLSSRFLPKRSFLIGSLDWSEFLGARQKYVFKQNACLNVTCTENANFKINSNETSIFGSERILFEFKKNLKDNNLQLSVASERQLAGMLPKVRNADSFQRVLGVLNHSFVPNETTTTLLRSALWKALCKAGYTDTALSVAGNLHTLDNSQLELLLEGCTNARPPRLSEGLELFERLRSLQGDLITSQWCQIFDLLRVSSRFDCTLSLRRSLVKSLHGLEVKLKEKWKESQQSRAGIWNREVVGAYVSAQAELALALHPSSGTKQNDEKDVDLSLACWQEALNTFYQLILSKPEGTPGDHAMSKALTSILLASAHCTTGDQFNLIWDKKLKEVVPEEVLLKSAASLHARIRGVYRARGMLQVCCTGLLPVVNHILKPIESDARSAQLQIAVLCSANIPRSEKLKLLKNLNQKHTNLDSATRNSALMILASTANTQEDLDAVFLGLEDLVNANEQIDAILIQEIYRAAIRLDHLILTRISLLERATACSAKDGDMHGLYRWQLLGYIKNNNICEALRTAKARRSMNKSLTLQEYIALLNGMISADDEDANSRKIKTRPYTTVWWITGEALKQGLRLDTRFLNCGLNVFAAAVGMVENEKVQKKLVMQAVDFLAALSSDLESKKLSPNEEFAIPSTSSKLITKDLFTYNILLKLFCKGGMMDRALLLLREMKGAGISPDEVSYNQLIRALAVGKMDIWAAEDVLMLMNTDLVPVSTRTVDAFLTGYLKSRRLGDAISCAQHMFNQHRVQPSCTVFGWIIDSALQAGIVYEAKRAWIVAKQIWPGIVLKDIESKFVSCGIALD